MDAKYMLNRPTQKIMVRRGNFFNGSLVCYPHEDEKQPENLPQVIQYLFGKNAVFGFDIIHFKPVIIIEHAFFGIDSSESSDAEVEIKLEDARLDF